MPFENFDDFLSHAIEYGERTEGFVCDPIPEIVDEQSFLNMHMFCDIQELGMITDGRFTGLKVELLRKRDQALYTVYLKLTIGDKPYYLLVDDLSEGDKERIRYHDLTYNPELDDAD